VNVSAVMTLRRRVALYSGERVPIDQTDEPQGVVG
jgi:hypothetical protein